MFAPPEELNPGHTKDACPGPPSTTLEKEYGFPHHARWECKQCGYTWFWVKKANNTFAGYWTGLDT